MAHILVLGGGFGGVSTAVRLREELTEDHQVTLVDRRESFSFGFRKTWALLGQSTMGAGQRPLNALERLGIKVVHGTITKLEPADRAAVVDGQRIAADYLVVALGAVPDYEAVPGFDEHGLSFYSLDRIPEAADRLAEFERGRVAILVLGVPYPCPPAPYETALLLNEYFENKGVSATLYVYSPLPMSLPVLGSEGCSVIEGRLEGQGIGFHPNHTVQRITAGQLHFPTGPVEYDLLIGFPGHLCPQVVLDSGLTGEAPWARVDPRTLETEAPNVFAIGDVVAIPLADGKRLPQAGVFAEAQGAVVAERIAARLGGQDSATVYGGSGACYLEVGGGSAMLVRGEFLAEPRPEVEVVGPAPQHFQAKRELERDRLQAWFGS